MGLSVMCNERWSFSGIELRTAANFRTSAEICRVPTVDKMLPIKWGIAIAARGQVSLWLGARGVLLLAETLVNGGLIVALIATLAALVGLQPVRDTEAMA